MRWALPFVALAILVGLGFGGAQQASGYGLRPLRIATPLWASADGCRGGEPGSLAAMRQAAAAVPWDPRLVWAGLATGASDSPLAAAWRSFVDFSKHRQGRVAEPGGTACAPLRLTAPRFAAN